jgi:hypothetical protein
MILTVSYLIINAMFVVKKRKTCMLWHCYFSFFLLFRFSPSKTPVDGIYSC